MSLDPTMECGYPWRDGNGGTYRCKRPVSHEGACWRAPTTHDKMMADLEGQPHTYVAAEPTTRPFPFAFEPSDYYGGDSGMETIEFIRARLGDVQFEAYCRGAILKYASRWGSKPGSSLTSDLAKIQDYARWAAEVAEGQALSQSTTRSTPRTCTSSDTSQE